MGETPRAEIGVFGGSGFYELFDEARKVRLDTPYGTPSDAFTVGIVGGRTVAFLPRHGRDHSIPPHLVNYRANIWAMRELGISRIIGPCAAGSLQPHVEPGHFVITDQFVDRTYGRRDTFYDGPKVVHISAADPYCPEMRAVAGKTAADLGIVAHPTGTVVVVQGPRFSTRAESRWYASQGWEVVNMTQYPEAYLARELGLCYVNIALITDYDAGAEASSAVTHTEVLRVFSENNTRLKDLIFAMVPSVPADRACRCAEAPESAGH